MTKLVNNSNFPHLSTQMLVVPVDGFEAGPHLPLGSRLGGRGSRTKCRPEEFIGEKDGSFAEIPNERAQLPVLSPA